MEDNSDAKLNNLLLYSQVAEDMPKGDVGQEGSPNQPNQLTVDFLEDVMPFGVSTRTSNPIVKASDHYMESDVYDSSEQTKLIQAFAGL